MTRVAWQIKKQEITKDAPSVTRKTFLYNLSRSSYEKNWGATYQRPGDSLEGSGICISLLPKVGPLRALAFERLTPETEKMYMASFNSTIDRYRELLSEQSAGRLKLPNDNLDVGALTPAGKYRLTDAAYAQLLHKLQGHYAEVPQSSEAIFSLSTMTLTLPNATRQTTDEWARVLEELDQLQSVDTDLRPAIAGVEHRPEFRLPSSTCRPCSLPACGVCREVDLTPVPLHHDIAATSVNPAVRYPVGARPRRLFHLPVVQT